MYIEIYSVIEDQLFTNLDNDELNYVFNQSLSFDCIYLL